MINKKNVISDASAVVDDIITKETIVDEENAPSGTPKKKRLVRRILDNIGKALSGPDTLGYIEQFILTTEKQIIELDDDAEVLFSRRMCPHCQTVKLEGGMQPEGFVRCNCPQCKGIYEQYDGYGRVYQILSEPKEEVIQTPVK